MTLSLLWLCPWILLQFVLLIRLLYTEERQRLGQRYALGMWALITVQLGVSVWIFVSMIKIHPTAYKVELTNEQGTYHLRVYKKNNETEP